MTICQGKDDMKGRNICPQISEPSSPVFVLKRGLDYVQQGRHAEGFALLALAREQLSLSQEHLANVFDAFVQHYTSYQRLQYSLQEMSIQLAQAWTELQAQATLLGMVLPKLIADLEVSNLSPISRVGGQGPDPSSFPSQDLQGYSVPSTSPAPVQGSTSLPALSINCFGRFEVRRLDQPVVLCTSRNGQSILRFLVAKSGYSATSDTLKALLWAEEEPEVAQRKLHHAISALRRSLDGSPPSEPNGGYIVCKNGIYALNPTVKIQTDVDKFLDCYHAGQQRSEERVLWYERACRLYKGPFLTEDMYADWSSLQREQLSKTYFAMCRVLADHYLRIKRYEDATRWVTAILQENHCDESAHQQLIQIYIAQGHRSEAIQQYQRCERILREELGVQPLPETTQLLQTPLLPPVEHTRSKNGEEM